MPQTLLFSFFFFSILLTVLHALPNPDPAPIEPFFPTSPPATIPAFPEQSDVAGCPLDLPEELFTEINHACGGGKRLSRTKCCPVLATWLYAAYSGTALERAGRQPKEPNYDMLPVLPDDSEGCVNNLEKALMGRGIELKRPNDTCDAVYCYCGIRLHVLSCPEAFSVSKEGKLVGDGRVKKVERDCMVSSLSGCSKCLQSLHQLNGVKGMHKNNRSVSDRKRIMHNRDCELMGLTWLLAKNRTAYVPTASAVLRAFMMSGADGTSHPRSCGLGRDGMPLAVDSAEINNQSASTILGYPSLLLLFLISLCIVFSTCS